MSFRVPAAVLAASLMFAGTAFRKRRDASNAILNRLAGAAGGRFARARRGICVRRRCNAGRS